METPLPPAIVAWIHELGEALWACARQQPNAALAELAPAVLQVVRAALPAGLAAVVTGNQATLDPARAPRRVRCPQCGGPSRSQGERSRQLMTVCGSLTYTRGWYRCRRQACGHGHSPTDQALQVRPGQRVSDDLAAWASGLGAELDFRAAAYWLARIGGIHLSHETVRRVTQTVGWELEHDQQTRIAALAVPRTAAEVEAATPAPGQLVVETDGVFARYREATGGSAWHEVKLGVVGGWLNDRLQQASYCAAREPAALFGERLAAEAGRRGVFDVVGWTGTRATRGVATLRHTLVLGDGASWIWHLAADRFAERTEIVDYWHAAEHLTTLAQAAFGADTPAAIAWAATQRTRLREAGATALLPTLAALPAPDPAAAQLLRRERAYFRTHQQRMAYPALTARGWPIGSGAVEGSAKHLVQQRLKRPGCRWSLAGAHAVLQVRCATLADLAPA